MALIPLFMLFPLFYNRGRLTPEFQPGQASLPPQVWTSRFRTITTQQPGSDLFAPFKYQWINFQKVPDFKYFKILYRSYVELKYAKLGSRGWSVGSLCTLSTTNA